MKRATLKDIDNSKFRIQPKALDERKCHYGDLSVSAKYLYGVMLDKFKLSKKNDWVNDKGEVWFIFVQKELAKLMGVSVRSVVNYINELVEHELLEKEATIQANKYYITLEYKQCAKFAYGMCKNCTSKMQNLRNNYTDLNDTDINETENLRVSDKTRAYIRYYDLEEKDLVRQVNNIISPNRRKITEENYYKALDKFEAVKSEYNTSELNKYIDEYLDEKGKGKSVENFIEYIKRYEL